MSAQDRKQEQARKRALAILQVQSGQKTATEAAGELGVSRQAYHQWEKRGMEGLLTALEEQSPGRPTFLEDPQKEKLQKEVRQLQQKLAVTEQIADLRGALLRDLEEEGAQEARSAIKKKKAESAKSCNEPRE